MATIQDFNSLFQKPDFLQNNMMIHIKHLLLVCGLAIMGATSCSKLSTNGPIDGMWRLEEMYSKPFSTCNYYSEYIDKRSEGIYWKFQLNLLSITSTAMLNGHTTETVARFNYDKDRLQITKTYIHFRDRDSLLTDANTSILQSIGIRGNASNYGIKRLTSSCMILCSENDSLVFYKLH